MFTSLFEGFVRIAGSAICDGRPCTAGQNVASNCIRAGKRCGIDMVFKIVFNLYSPTGSLAKCLLKCVCVSEEFIIVNGQCHQNLDKEASIKSQQSKVS